MRTRAWGWRPDPKDERDLPLRAAIGTLADSPPPSAASVEHPRVRPKDQLSTSSCTGQAWAQALRLGYLQLGMSCPELSAFFNYFTNRAEFGEQYVDLGSHLRAGASASRRFGCATEAAWPSANSEWVNVEPGYSAFRSAHGFRGPRSYHRVSSVPDDVRRALASGFAVVGGWDVDKSFEQYSGRGALTRPRADEIIGGHALTVVGYAADGTFRLLNSWGTAWGQSGFGLCDEGFIAAGADLWIADVRGPVSAFGGNP